MVSFVRQLDFEWLFICAEGSEDPAQRAPCGSFERDETVFAASPKGEID
jgi:hypothetical protein